MFPNPVYDRVYVNVTGHREWNWRLSDMSGVLLNNGAWSEPIMLNNYPSGVYLLEIMLPDGSRVTKKIIH
jgi:hypothetical protein